MSNEQNSAWRWFPIASLAALGLVVIVNAGMIYTALHTFPGENVHGGFETSNNYEEILDTAAQQAALGWNVDAKTDGGHAVLNVTGRDGQPLANPMVQATAHRPVGPSMTTDLVFDADAGSQFHSEQALPQAGQWDLTILVASGADKYTVTRRVLVK